MKEDRLAMLFVDSVRRVSLPDEKVEWAKQVLAESKSKQIKTQNQKMSSLLSWKTRTENRLSNLYDLRIDGDLDNDVF